MEAEIDINLLINIFVQKNALLQKENAILEAKYQSLLSDYMELKENNNELQKEISQKWNHQVDKN